MSNATAFSPETHCVLAIKGTDLFKLSLANQELLVAKINEGYDRFFKKYDIIVGRRLHGVSTFQVDAGFAKHPANCVLYVFIEKDPSVYLPLKQSENIKAEVFEGYEFFFIMEQHGSILKLNKQCIKGTTAFKPHQKYDPNLKIVELTCFVSFLPRLGLTLLPLTENHYKGLYNPEKYIGEVVKEHELVEYYEKYHGYKLTSETFVPVQFDTEETGVPKDFYLKSSFHFSVLEKDLQ